MVEVATSPGITPTPHLPLIEAQAELNESRRLLSEASVRHGAALDRYLAALDTVFGEVLGG